jgi:adenylate cyclase
MKWTRRARREWRIFLWVSVASAVASAYFGYSVRADDKTKLLSVLIGVATSLAVATPIVLLELKGGRIGVLRRLRRLPLAVYFAFKVVFYLVVIVVGVVGVEWLFSQIVPGTFHPLRALHESILFAIGMSIFGNLVFEMGGLLGFATLRNLLTGRYVQPRKEERAFVLIDMKDSTGLAEKLGPTRFHALLNAFFQDIAHAALECEAEIHKYVGDEAILTWSGGDIASGACLACPFVARDAIDANRQRYLRRFGGVPSFRAAIHCGEIVAGEIGDVRREIAFVGDTLNVAARLLEATKSLRRDILASDDVLRRAALPAGLAAAALPTLSVRGRAAPLAIAALERMPAG